jgi:vacuolar iron transporter family protein
LKALGRIGSGTGGNRPGSLNPPMKAEDLHKLEHRVREVPEALEEFGPDYAVELDPKAHKIEGSGIRDATLGANDGLVSVLTILAGAAGAATGKAVLLAGVAALVGGAISMGIGAYVSAKAYRAYFLKELQRELLEMRELPDVEREEIREVYRARGFQGEALEMVVDTITSDPKVWLRVMMQEELGLSQGFGQPLGAATTVAVAFLVGGFVPIMPFLFVEGAGGLGLSFVLTAIALVGGGAIRARFTGENVARAGSELIAMAAVGVGVAFGIGRLLHAVGV